MIFPSDTYLWRRKTVLWRFAGVNVNQAVQRIHSIPTYVMKKNALEMDISKNDEKIFFKNISVALKNIFF